MRELRLALVADGASDRALIPIVLWLVRRIVSDLVVAEPGFVAGPHRSSLRASMQRALERHRPDILIVHRDAERTPLAERRAEILDVDGQIQTVRLVPVRMTEAWLLIDEAAIRAAAGNPNGRDPLLLPNNSQLERLPDPKSRMHECLIDASGKRRGRRRHMFKRDISLRVQRVAELIEDFSPLMDLPAFKVFADDLRHALQAMSEHDDGG